MLTKMENIEHYNTVLLNRHQIKADNMLLTSENEYYIYVLR